MGNLESCVRMTHQWSEEPHQENLENLQRYELLFLSIIEFILLFYIYTITALIMTILYDNFQAVELEYLKSDLIPMFINLAQDEQVNEFSYS